MEKLIICVTPNLTVFERTGTKNKRIYNNDVRSVDNAEVTFEISESEVVVRVVPDDKEVDPFFRVIKEQGAFCIYADKINHLADSNRKVKALYKSLKDKYNDSIFTIHEEKDLEKPFKVLFHIRAFEKPKRHFIIYIQDSETLHEKVSGEIIELVDAAMNMDLITISEYYEAFTLDGVVVELDQEFIELYEEMSEVSKTK